MNDLLHARVTGKVQGVGFRVWTKREADRLALCGFVRNCADGSVEACFQGPQAALAKVRVLLGEGPAMARVVGVDMLESAYATLMPAKGVVILADA